MRSLLLCCVTVLLASSSAIAGDAATRSFWIGQFGHGQASGSQFSTTINLINLSTTASTITLKTFDDDGNLQDLLRGTTPPFDPVDERTVILAGRGTGTVVSDTAGDELRIGYGQASSANAVAVEVVFSLRDALGNVITATNVRIAPLVTAASFFGRANSEARTGVALLLPPGSDGPTDVDLTIFNSDGTVRGVATVPLQVGQKVSQFLDELVPGLSNFAGSVEVRSSEREPISILPLRQEGLVLTTQDLFPPRQLDN